VAAACPAFAGFFAPRHFAALRRARDGRVGVHAFFDLVMRKVSLQQVRLALAAYDGDGRGALTVHELEHYIFDLIPTLPPLAPLGDDFHGTYAAYAARKFVFFLDPRRARRVAIADLVLSDVLAEFSRLPDDAGDGNWFAPPAALRVYETFCALDVAREGLLGPAGFARYGAGALTAPCVARLFDEAPTYKGRLDFRTFVDFVLAKENPKSEPVRSGLGGGGGGGGVFFKFLFF
jgi:serine/threonine-protein phosphatase 2A regulatory subunit B''